MESQTYNFKLNNQNVIDNFLSSSPKLIKNKFKFDDSYYQSVKKYFNTIKSNNYTIKDNYKNSDSGRMMGVKTTIQKLSNDLRGELFKNDGYDIDMVNASFNIVIYIINTFFQNKVNDFKTIFDYGINRDKYLKYGFDKTKMISVLFNDDPKSFIKSSVYDDKFNRLLLEISLFQDHVLSNIHLFNYKYKPNSTKGSKLSYIIFNLENQILQEVINEFKDIIVAPIFDGVIINKECDLNNVLTKCNDIGSKYNVTFINKPFPESKLDLDSPPNYDDCDNAYNDMKTTFEKNHFLIEDPLIYIKEYESNGETKFIYYNKGDFKDSVATYNIDDKDGKEVPFFNIWLKDTDRRSYKTIGWIPSLDDKHNRHDNYNTFKGFNSNLVDVPEKKYETVNDDYDGKAVIRFINHMNHLVNYEADGLTYLKKYIADMFQNPTILPEVAILFKSKQGSGKDLFTSILGNILGNTLIHKDAKMENITGNFNDDLMNKLIIQLNEVCGSDGNFNREILKDLITTEQFNINPKYGKKLKCNNYARIIAASNNKTPLNIPQDDRRYVVFKCADPKDKSYYDKLGSIKSDKRALNSIYSYFMTMDISKFNIKDRYISQEYKNIQSATSNPFHEYLYEICNNKDDLINIRTHKGDDIISCNDIYEGYTAYLEHNNLSQTIKTNNRDMRSNMLECGAVDAKPYINKIQVRCFKLQFSKLKLYLEKHYIKDNDEETIYFEDEELEFDDEGAPVII
tara:strand:+ start:690 stop:2906 length:2217 start_codon:yes stop_codon:yes gene_type:complete